MNRNCRDCEHLRTEQHIAPPVLLCRAMDGTIGCQGCKAFLAMDQWKFAMAKNGRGQVKCPGCGHVQTIPKADDWRNGCCSTDLAAAVVVPFGGHRHGATCGMFSQVVTPAEPQQPERCLF